MSDSKIDYVNPYATLAQQHKDGLDAIITSIGTGGPGTVSLDDLTDAVYDYVVSVYTSGGSNIEAEVVTRASISNAINGYLDNGGSSPYLSTLLSAPVVSIDNLFTRLFDASRAASRLKSSAGREQLVLAIGEADAEYWGAQIATTGSWTAYMSGGGAVDVLTIPYWVDAAMFGAMFDYYQVDGSDVRAASGVLPSALIGSLAVAAGKVVFGWVPKNAGALNGPVVVTEKCGCNGGAKMLSGEMSHIGRPIGGVAQASNTTWYTVGGSKGGTDYRYYKNKHPCISLHNYYSGGQEHIVGGDDC